MKNIKKFVICLSLVFVMIFSCFSLTVTNFSNASMAPSTSEIERPESLAEGLSRKSLQELQGKRVTIRQPQMKVTERGIHRTAPKLLSNTFNLPDFKTGEISAASITFSKYPGIGSKNEKFSNFEKYMLLREVFWLNQNAMKDAASGDLGKHPAADLQYGELEVADNAVEKWILTDPEYRSPMTTGLYLAPGEVSTVKVSGLKKGESVTLYTHHQSTMGYANGDVNAYFDRLDKLIIDESKKQTPNYEGLEIDLNGQYERQNEEIPAIGATFVLTDNTTYSIGCPFGGVLYVKPTSSPVELTIRGAVETPHFILGVTTVDEFEQHLRNAPGLFATLDCENGQLIGPSKDMRNVDDIEKLAYFWHSAFAVDTSFNGRAYNYNITLSFDTHVPAGAAVALSSDRAAMPTSWFSTCMNYQKLTTQGQWGTFHELGHIHAKAYDMNWGMRENGEGEVWNNTLIILIYTLLCDMDPRVANIEHGEFTHPYTTLNYIQNRTIKDDYKNGDYFDMLSLYATLIHSFGPETFVDFLYTYSQEKAYCENSRADFAYRFARVTNMNIVKWLNHVYKANITESMFSKEQLKELSEKKNFYPIAYRYANGTNEHETARKHEIDFANPTVFDFSGDNILCPVSFEIISYTKPKHGTIVVDENGTTVTYTPAKNRLYENDEFAVRVRISSTGVDVYLPVRLQFGYTNAFTQVWDNVGTRDLAKAEEFASGNPLSYTKVESTSGVKEYNANIDGKSFESYLKTKFKFIATKTGTHRFYTRSDDSSVVTFSYGAKVIGSLSIKNDRSSYDKNDFVEQYLSKGDIVEIETSHVNYGGKCYLTVGVQFPDAENIVEIPKENRLNFNLTAQDLEKIKDFGWKPKFFVSIKNAYKANNVSKENWQVLEAPENQEAAANKEAIIDGDYSTFFHGQYKNGGVPFPHVFVFDTSKIQNFNYFEIYTRSNPNSKIVSMTLLGSTDNQNYQALYSTDSLVYNNLKATINFNETTLRYFKLEVTKTTSNNGPFTVIAEVNAGLSAKMEQAIKPSTLQSSSSGFEEDAFGQLSAKTANSVFTFEFTGSGFDVFANKSPEFGSAKVFVDDEEVGTIDLGDERAINCVVFSKKDLVSKKHVVNIVTQDSKEFNISFLNVDYGVDTGETVEPAPQPFQPAADEVYVNGHKFEEEVVIIPEPDEVDNSAKVLVKAILIVCGCLAAVVAAIVAICLYSKVDKKAKKKK